MNRLRSLIGAMLAACGAAAPAAEPPRATVPPQATVPSQSAATAPPAPPLAARRCLDANDPQLADATRADLDGDQLDDWIVRTDRTLMFVVARDDCREVRTTLDPEGRIAFVSVDGDGPPRQMRGVTVDMWLYHGDRKRQRYRWAGDRYVPVGEAELVPGPRRK